MSVLELAGGDRDRGAGSRRLAGQLEAEEAGADTRAPDELPMDGLDLQRIAAGRHGNLEQADVRRVARAHAVRLRARDRIAVDESEAVARDRRRRALADVVVAGIDAARDHVDEPLLRLAVGDIGDA